MTPNIAPAFTPLKIGPITLRNRLIKSATNEGMAKAGGIVSKGLARFHERMAEGGASLTTVAYCATSPDGRTFIDQAVIDANSVRDFRALTDGVHKHGAAASAQITHAGCFTFIPNDKLATPRPLSANGGFNKVGVLSGKWLKQAMTLDDFKSMTQEFVNAARAAREAGFDAVELHMGHGYLLSQFISKFYNRRRDSYGGSIENRARFPVEVLSRVLDGVGKDLAVVCKISMTDGKSGGNTIEDGVAVTKALQAAGAHLIVLSNGLNVESVTTMFGSSFPQSNRVRPANPIVALGMFIQQLTEPKDVQFRENYSLECARAVRKAVTVPLAYLGGIVSAEGIAQVMSEGFETIAMGRVLVHDPGFVNAIREGRIARSGCTSCNRCVTMMYTAGGTSCVLQSPNDATLNTQHAGAAV